MKALILAAGQGTRLRPFTDNLPKCLVEYQGRPLLEYTLEALKLHGIHEVGIVTGYCSDKLHPYGLTEYFNPRFATTNMVESLFCAKEFLFGDVVVIYGDIIFRPSVLNALIESSDSFPVVIDTAWRTLWEKRMEDPLLDAETLQLNQDGSIRDLGKKPQSLDEIQGQYMGLFKFGSQIIDTVKTFYHNLDRNARYEGRSFEQMFMTSFLQELINSGLRLQAVPVVGGWLEIDAPNDLNVRDVL